MYVTIFGLWNRLYNPIELWNGLCDILIKKKTVKIKSSSQPGKKAEAKRRRIKIVFILQHGVCTPPSQSGVI